MNIEIFFKHINHDPHCDIMINNISMYKGAVVPKIPLELQILGDIVLEIAFTNKKPDDTVVNDEGKIIQDKNFELDKILIDGYDFNEFIWNSEYQANDGNVYPSCLFFGPPGKFVILFSSPFLPWLLKTRHEKYNNDPSWEEDYNYYTKAWNILKQIQTK